LYVKGYPFHLKKCDMDGHRNLLVSWNYLSTESSYNSKNSPLSIPLKAI